MFAVRERNQIGIVVGAFPDNCASCWAITKTHDDVMGNYARHARQRNGAHTPIEQIARTELIQQRGTEGVNEAQLKIRPGVGDWIGETPNGVPGILVCRSEPVELAEKAIVLAMVVVQPQRRFVPVEKISIGLDLVRTDDAFQEIAVPVERAG